MAKAAKARATRRGGRLPEEIVVWEILVRLPPKSLLRCRSVCRAWRRVTSTRDFLLAHHGHQPSLPIFSGDTYRKILDFDHRATTIDDQLHAVTPLDETYNIEASCDGLLVLCKRRVTESSGSCLIVWNPATRQRAPLRQPPWYFRILGMYPHRPTGEYRLLLQRMISSNVPDQIGLYVFVLGSDQPVPGCIGWPEIASGIFNKPVRVHHSLHWYPVNYRTEQYEWESRLIAFDTIAETFRQMRAPILPIDSQMFDMEGTFGIYSHNYATGVMDIWVLQNYTSEVWDLKHRIKLPLAKIKRGFVDFDVVSVDGGVYLLVNKFDDRWLFHVDGDGKLVNSFDWHSRHLYIPDCRLKQSLVQHAFFHAPETYDVNASPSI